MAMLFYYHEENIQSTRKAFENFLVFSACLFLEVDEQLREVPGEDEGTVGEARV